VLVTAPGAREALPAVRSLLAGVDTTAVPERGAAGTVELDVHYDGEDLELVARDAGCDVDEVIARHTGATLTVAFGGFAPGFGYLTGLPADLHVPRRATPRSRVPAGAVGLAGPYAGVYPRASPGGWQLVGRTDAVLFDVDRDPPALLAPGTSVRFRAC
jgi:KipI family sensor histidine kinase inhibitor